MGCMFSRRSSYADDEPAAPPRPVVVAQTTPASETTIKGVVIGGDDLRLKASVHPRPRYPSSIYSPPNTLNQRMLDDACRYRSPSDADSSKYNLPEWAATYRSCQGNPFDTKGKKPLRRGKLALTGSCDGGGPSSGEEKRSALAAPDGAVSHALGDVVGRRL
ncbi:hypothetical protein PV08_03987 [Exophiala spinifera]|uniref:Uncharacterized protein n=1 Tax=Exophiala spinifera TaxID=91928 RepID=A0A0D1ZVQ3_9EURO|nr:uncharacterized protein PV08_03987 [Exophiala spinifera]KIW16797.1 hypothetical protein PV08_03987 [Exophiala spinifera]